MQDSHSIPDKIRMHTYRYTMIIVHFEKQQCKQILKASIMCVSTACQQLFGGSNMRKTGLATNSRNVAAVLCTRSD